MKSRSSRLGRGVVLQFLLSCSAYCTIVDSYQTYGLLTQYGYPYSGCFPIAVSFSVRYLLSDDPSLLVLVVHCLNLCGSRVMYISALDSTLGTPSKFSSVPILVADELVLFLHLCNHDPRGILL